MPLHTESATTLHAICIGNREEIERLLKAVTHIGKKGAIGYGRVARWTVTESDHTIDDVLAARAVPLAYTGEHDDSAIPRGWTPPYWYAPWWLPCRAPR